MMIGILLMAACSFFIAVSDFLFKSGSNQVDLAHPWRIFNNRVILLGVFTTIGSFLLNVTAYRFGDIVVLYPLLQLALVWSMLGAYFLFKERVNLRVIFGVSLILGGVIFLAMSPT